LIDFDGSGLQSSEDDVWRASKFSPGCDDILDTWYLRTGRQRWRCGWRSILCVPCGLCFQSRVHYVLDSGVIDCADSSSDAMPISMSGPDSGAAPRNCKAIRHRKKTGRSACCIPPRAVFQRVLSSPRRQAKIAPSERTGVPRKVPCPHPRDPPPREMHDAEKHPAPPLSLHVGLSFDERMRCRLHRAQRLG
jgi:hypothetical protein